MTRPPEDLLTPTLTKADDVPAGAQPWNPTLLVVATFFLGLFAGGGLLALNFKRLGQPRRVLPTLLVVGVVVVVIAAVTGWLIARHDLMDADRNVRQGYRFVVQVLNLAIALGIARFQQAVFRSHQRSGHPSGSLWKPVLLALPVALVVEFGLRLLFVLLWSL